MALTRVTRSAASRASVTGTSVMASSIQSDCAPRRAPMMKVPAPMMQARAIRAKRLVISGEGGVAISGGRTRVTLHHDPGEALRLGRAEGRGEPARHLAV